MSRYFERLARQIGQAPAQGRSVASSLEQHFAVETPPPAAHAESASIGSLDVATPKLRGRELDALSHQGETRRLVVPAPAARRHDPTRVTPEPAPYTAPLATDISLLRAPVSSATPAAPAARTEGMEPTTTFTSSAPRTTIPASLSDSAQPAPVPGQVDVVGALGVIDMVSVPADERVAPRQPLPRSRAMPTTPPPLRAEQHTQAVMRDRRGVPDVITAAAEPRVEVHVGSITMEVYAPEFGQPLAPPVPTPPARTLTPTVAAAAPTAAARFSPSRHYLRWG